MKLKKLLFLGTVSALALTACSPQKENSAILNTGDGIINGEDVEEGHEITKSIVAVFDVRNKGTCTGSLLENNIVLTAAHCVINTDMVAIIFGNDLSSKNIQYFFVDKIAISPYYLTNYRNKMNTGDVALLHFVGEVPEGYEPATLLPNKHVLRKGRKTVLAGYGISDGVAKTGSGLLRMTTVKIDDAQFSISEVKLNQTEGTGACHGDSGGPAYILARGKYYLWGITSRGVDDQNDDCSQYSAYTSALFYKGWIEETSEKLVEAIAPPDATIRE